MEADITGKGGGGLSLVYLGIVSYRLREPVVSLIGGVVFQHIQDEAFVDGLFHRIKVKRLRLSVYRPGSKDFKRLVFGVAVKPREEEKGFCFFPPFSHLLINLCPGHQAHDRVSAFGSLNFLDPQHAFHFGSAFRLPLGAVSLINNDCIFLLQRGSYLLSDKGELLKSRNDYW